MKPLFWVGIVMLVLGIASFFIAIPQRERHSVGAAGVEVGVETRYEKKVPAWVGGALVLGGIGLMFTGSRMRAA